MNIVIVGHVDHGKSTMIGRLLCDTQTVNQEKIDEIKKVCSDRGVEFEYAYILDALEEERDQGITIDTTQTYFQTAKRKYVIIDAPGHREFTKNMITGASQAEAAILIVDANEGVKEQTMRHAYILGLLGLKQVVVVINKMDLENYSQEKYDELVGGLEKFLSSINIKASTYIPVSARKGDNIAVRSDNMSWYTGHTVIEVLDSFISQSEMNDLPLRMPVQDVYKVDDKRIIAGRVEAGIVSMGREVVVLPSGERTMIQSVEEFLNDQKIRAVSGESTGVVTQDKLFIDRGNVISDVNDEPRITNSVKAKLFWMSKDSLKKGEKLSFRCSTQEVTCTIEKIEKRVDSSTLEIIESDASEVKNREVGEVLLTFDKELIVDDFNKTPELGRFVIEKGTDTAGGGIITFIND